MPVRFLIFLSVLLAACHEKEVPQPAPEAPFETLPMAVSIPDDLEEASGIVSSRSVPGSLWILEDSGNPPQLFSLNADGTLRKKVFVKGATNRDWEDMAWAGDTLYISETGDNLLAQNEYAVYKFAEPAAATDTVTAFEKIRFVYPDGSHNAEALLVDAKTKDLYIITKNDQPAVIYKIAYPYSGKLNAPTAVGTLPYGPITGAAMSADGSEILVRTISGIYYYHGENLLPEALLKTSPQMLEHALEPQGEAVTFSASGNGYFSISEKNLLPAVKLNFYKRH